MGDSDLDDSRNPVQLMYRASTTVCGFLLMAISLATMGYGIYDMIVAGVTAGSIGALLICALMAVGGAGMFRLGRARASSTDVGSTDNGSTDNGSTDDGLTDDGSTDHGSTDHGSTNKHILKGDQQRAILEVARGYDGRLTPAKVTLETSLEIAQAQRALDEFVLQDVAELQITDAGRQIYVFADFVDPGGPPEPATSALDDEVALEFAELSNAQHDRAGADDDRADADQPATKARAAGAPSTTKTDQT